MHTGQLGGRIGALRDPATGQTIDGSLSGTFTYTAPGDPNAVVQQVQQRLLQTVQQVLQQKLTSYQVAVPTMSGSLPYYTQEIIGQCQLADLGVTITDLQLQLQVNAPPAPAPYAGPMPPDPMTAMKNSLAEQAKERLDPSNYEVRAKMNIGGFKVNASTDGGLDTDSLGEQAKEKVKSTVIWWGIGCVVILFVVGLLGAIAIYAYTQMDGPTSSTGGGKAATWDGKSSFVCKGNDNVTLSGVTATIATGSAITASANCQLTLTNVTIAAPVGIEASGNAKVTVSGGSISGSEAAVKASGLAQVTFSGTTVSGDKNAEGAAKITGP